MDPRCGVEWCHIAPITGRNIFTNVGTPTIFARIRLQCPAVRNMECLSESGGGEGDKEETLMATQCCTMCPRKYLRERVVSTLVF